MSKAGNCLKSNCKLFQTLGVSVVTEKENVPIKLGNPLRVLEGVYNCKKI